jgi:hypothetical protein
MIKVGGGAKLITQHLRVTTGKSIKAKDVHNIKQKYQKTEEEYTGNNVVDLQKVGGIF